jgi:thioredoxin 1
MVTTILLGILIGGAIGTVLGYVGKCATGTCPLTVNPYRGALYGAPLGAFLALIFSVAPKQSPTQPEEEPAPAKQASEVPKKEIETVKENVETSDVGQTKPPQRDIEMQTPAANGSSLMESLAKDSFLQKVFNYEQNKEWKFEGKLPCIVDFYADWCGPCKMVEPILQELAQEYQGKLNIYRVDTQAQQELAAAFGIQSIPSILFVPLNDKPQMARGALPKETLEKAIREVLKVK